VKEGEYYVFVYEYGKIRPVKTSLTMGAGRDKGK
jgi:hypothetical protein